MFDVSTTTITHEFSIYQTGKPDAGYLIELDGDDLAWDTSLQEAHRYIKKHAKANKLVGAGVTEVFGRNRQFITTSRYGFKTIKRTT